MIETEPMMEARPNQADSGLPSFGRPPVVETVLGVQFDIIPGFSNAHLGAFWKTHLPDWPSTTDAPPLEPQFERFGEDRMWAKLNELAFKFTTAPTMRVQIRNAENSRMVQLQNGRLHYNWIGEGSKYVRYDTLRPEFDDIFRKFSQFVADEKLGVIRLNQWEVTYVNHLRKGIDWKEPADWNRLFHGLVQLPPKLESVQLESFGGEWHYEIPEKQGRLHVQLQHGRETVPPENEILILNLTARGPLSSDGDPREEFDNGLSIGHAVVVKSFAGLTSQDARSIWEQQP